MADLQLGVIETRFADMIAYAKEKAVNQENKIVIHKKDGKIRKQKYNNK